MAKPIEIGEDSKLCFTEIYEDGSVQDGVQAKIAKTDAVIGNQTM
jgi:hypothetical protein